MSRMFLLGRLVSSLRSFGRRPLASLCRTAVAVLVVTSFCCVRFATARASAVVFFIASRRRIVASAQKCVGVVHFCTLARVTTVHPSLRRQSLPSLDMRHHQHRRRQSEQTRLQKRNLLPPDARYGNRRDVLIHS